MMEISNLIKQSLSTDTELERVEIFILHHSIPENTIKCLASLIAHTDWPYKITVLDTSVYPRGLLAKIYNKLIKESTCDYIAFVCSDSEFNQNWLKKFMTYLKNNKKVGCIVPLTNPPVNKEMDVKTNTGEYEIPASALSMSISLFRKNDIVCIGGFDEKFYLYGHDVDLLKKMSKKHVFILDSSITVEHNVGSTTKMVFTKDELNEVDNYLNSVKDD